MRKEVIAGAIARVQLMVGLSILSSFAVNIIRPGAPLKLVVLISVALYMTVSAVIELAKEKA